MVDNRATTYLHIEPSLYYYGDSGRGGVTRTLQVRRRTSLMDEWGKVTQKKLLNSPVIDFVNYYHNNNEKNQTKYYFPISRMYIYIIDWPIIKITRSPIIILPINIRLSRISSIRSHSNIKIVTSRFISGLHSCILHHQTPVTTKFQEDRIFSIYL